MPQLIILIQDRQWEGVSITIANHWWTTLGVQFQRTKWGFLKMVDPQNVGFQYVNMFQYVSTIWIWCDAGLERHQSRDIARNDLSQDGRWDLRDVDQGSARVWWSPREARMKLRRLGLHSVNWAVLNPCWLMMFRGCTMSCYNCYTIQNYPVYLGLSQSTMGNTI